MPTTYFRHARILLLAIAWLFLFGAPAFSESTEAKSNAPATTLKSTLESGSIEISNVKDGEERRYPVVLLKGTAHDATTVSVINRSDNRSPKQVNQAPIVDGHFKILVELVPGDNEVCLEAGQERLVRLIKYRRPTVPFKVEVVYITADDGATSYLTQFANDKQDYRDKLDTAIKLFQTFTAEQMNAAGYGYKTFDADYDDNGKVVVHVKKYPETADTLRHVKNTVLYEKFRTWLIDDFPATRFKTIGIMAFVGYDADRKKTLGHTSLGRDPLALFSCNGMCSWPSSIADVSRCFNDTTSVDTSKLWDDTNSRPQLWALASTTLGATLHELGHTFGLRHDGDHDPLSVMERGFDHTNRFFSMTEPSASGSDLVDDAQAARWGSDSTRVFSHSLWFRPDGITSTVPPDAPLTLDNVKNGDERRYPLILMRGTAGGATTVSAINNNARPAVSHTEAPIVGGKYKLLVELAPGDNLIHVEAGKQHLDCLVKYRIPTTKHKVSLVYVTGPDGDTRYLTQIPDDKQNFKSKLDTSIKLLQTSVAETMNQAGYGYKTFAVDYDDDGQAIVRVLKSREKVARLRKLDEEALYQKMKRWLVKEYPPENIKTFATLAFTGYDSKAKKLLGNTANAEDSVAVFSSNGMCSWPDTVADVPRAFSNTTPVDTTKIWDDTNGRPEFWALASTTIGVRLFQLGQTIALKDQTGEFDIMWRGFDHFNRLFMQSESSGTPAFVDEVKESEVPTWDPQAAKALSRSAWLQSDELGRE